MLSCSKMLYCSKWSNIDMAAEPTERSAQRARARSSERFALTRTALAATRPADFERLAGIAPQQPLLIQLSSFRHGRASSRPSTSSYPVAGCKDVDAQHI